MLTKLDPWPTYQMLEGWPKACPTTVLSNVVPMINPHRLAPQRPSQPVCSVRQTGRGSRYLKRLASSPSVADIALVDNLRDLGLAVAEAMAAGLPLVVSDWNGYRDLVRDGMDGFGCDPLGIGGKRPVPWDGSKGPLSLPQVAGALGQLVHVDTCRRGGMSHLADSLRVAPGAAAHQRACDTFHPDVVMSQLRQEPDLDRQTVLRTALVQSPAGSGTHICLLCHPGRGWPWFSKKLKHFLFLRRSFISGPVMGFCRIPCPRSATMTFGPNLVRKHSHQRRPERALMNLLALHGQTSPLADNQPLAALVVPGLLCCSVRGNSSLVIESRVDLGGPGAASSSGDGWGVSWDDLLAGPARVP